ncbi:potassium uptake protein, TrkH family [Archaeoglobus sulfaticallidus PM70-1]|uniref:Potassium uptake protein, TrkH family n=1 Tax=Archaeoglobus sulfaticallidus PM70-1 TaxID=387631 RepID=N0BF99_9EURY|nr:TrkH family potassium uptake protein [Archaeoglobus sulfaticallidus]AGK61698.1 potassium uptake protein, TrkH family [Archaeoglobus sulfaticallidus PM70-1]
MNYLLVINFLGRIMLYFTALFSLPLITAFIFKESFYPFLVAIAVNLIISLILYSVKPKSEVFRYKEGFAIVGLGWFLISLIGAIPYCMIGTGFIDAIFESMSGFTTTGATIFDRIEVLPKSILLWRSLTEWVGGMGIIVLFVAVFPSIAKKGYALFQAEVPGITVSKVTPRLKDTALRLWEIYLLFTVLEVALLYLAGLNLFDAINHSFTTMSTGGFSTHTESIAYYRSPLIETIITIFMIVAGVNFSLHYYWLKGDARILRDPEFKAYISLLAIAIACLTILNSKGDLIESFRYSAFNAVSLMTTTGYASYDFDRWMDSSKLIILTLMFIGGCSGSTAGGIKVIRIYLLEKYSIHQILKEADPRTARVIKMNDRILKKEIIDDITAFFVLYVLIFAVSSVVISLFGMDLLSAVSAVVATMSNVGPGLGAVGATESYSALHPVVKLILFFNMWAGRLELFTVLSLFIPSFWKERW